MHSPQGASGSNPAYGASYPDKSYPTSKRPRRWWPWIVGAIVAIVIILAAVLGGVLGSRAANDDDNDTKSNAAADRGSNSGVASAATRTQGSGAFAVVPTATDQFGNPMYPSATGSAQIAEPTISTSNSSLACTADDTSSISLDSPKTTHPLLIATENRWSCLPSLIEADSYMSYWNDTVFQNASRFYDTDTPAYIPDGGLGGSGVLDIAREVQLRIKHWAYAYKLSGDVRWVNRTWEELQVAAGNTSTSFGNAGDNWNSQHFLDVAEFTEAFALAYDWMYDAWTAEQRTAIAWSIITLGLQHGLDAINNDSAWWRQVQGNWNCVCNKGLMMGALAIVNEDPTGTIARQMIDLTVPNAVEYCSFATAANDGTWTETPNYWYFGTYSHVEMAASLLTATGSTQNLLSVHEDGTKYTALYHMHTTGMQGLFSYGDAGPNKYTATANGIMFYGQQYNLPVYTLFQRDRGDAPEPMSLLYYNPQVEGQFFQGLALDRHFSNSTDSWFAARSSWTDNDGTYIAMKSGYLQGHQTHGDLDAGTFVLDAMGERWAGELGSGDYLSQGYFDSEAQDSPRWLYYRKRTEGQNTILVNKQNQLVTGQPTTSFGSTNDEQDALVYTPSNSSTAYFTTDISEMNEATSSAKRAIRFLNGRRQVLLRDEITSTAAVQWRMHTNATVTLSDSDRTATLELNGKTLIATLRSPSGGTFGTADAVRDPSDPTTTQYNGNTVTMSEDQPNPGVTVLTIDVAEGTNVIEVLFNPQWAGWSANSFVSPPDVAIDDWSVTSHE
ncbi:uncharacterized protein JCM10292_005541 [Rhodotorula paludigena]|uniref:uncharacterized protein n=1 Tax=Rhodotorula paludigena TaxID=86838 RepID=UPI0031748595